MLYPVDQGRTEADLNPDTKAVHLCLSVPPLTKS